MFIQNDNNTTDMNIFSVKMLFIFTRKFYEEFDGLDGKSAEEYIQVLIKIVQNSFKDKTMRNEIGTVVQIVADTKIYEGDLEWYEPTYYTRTNPS